MSQATNNTMNIDQIEALRLLIEFGRNVEYNDSRYAPKDVNKWCDEVEAYLDES